MTEVPGLPDRSAKSDSIASVGDRFDSDWQRLWNLSGISQRLYRVIRRQVANIDRRPARLLVVTSSHPQMPIAWAKWSRSAGRELDLTLIHRIPSRLSQQVVAAAIEQGHQIRCLDIDCYSDRLPNGYDVVVNLHVMHQLREDQVFRQLQSMAMTESGTMIVCDHARSHANAWITRFGMQLASTSPEFRQRAAAQVGTAYSIAEFQRIAQSALPHPVNVQGLFPGHFLMTCEESRGVETIPAFA